MAWIGGLLALAGGIAGAQGSEEVGEQVTTTAPWAGQQPYLTSGFKSAQGLYGQELSPQAIQFWLQGMNMAGSQSPLMGMSQDQLMRTISGQDIGKNINELLPEATKGITRQYMRSVVPNIGGRFGSSGRFGSGAYNAAMRGADESLAQAISGTAAQLYSGERSRQQQALALAPGYEQQRYADVDRGIAYALAPQQEQWNQLAQYMNIVGGQGYGDQTIQPLYGNPYMGAIGGVATGYSLAKAMGLFG